MEASEESNYNSEKMEDGQQVVVNPQQNFFNDRILTDKDMKFFEDNGYLVVRNLIPNEMCTAVVNAIWEFLEMDPKSGDWYKPPATPLGMIELYNHQAMWDTRQHPSMYKVFTELWGTHKLWVSIDRVCMKPPRNVAHPEWDRKGFVHWDLDPWEDDIPFGLQGVLCLEDTDENQGGFHCVPGMHKYIREWTKKIKPLKGTREKFHTRSIPINVPKTALNKLPLKKIPAKKGDFIIWRREIAHGNGHNITNRPRLAQYINMYPSRGDYAGNLTPQQSLHGENRGERISIWKGRCGTPDKPGDSRKWEKRNPPAELTELGKKLLGLEDWE